MRNWTIDDLMRNIEIEPVFKCWIWTGDATGNGYPVFRGLAAHRLIYEHAYGPIASGLVADHGCRVRLCCNPLHIEAVDKSENERRKQFRWLLRRKKCRFGHALNETTRVVTSNSGVLCRTCQAGAGVVPSGWGLRGRYTPISGGGH